MTAMAPELIMAAFAGESRRLSEVMTGLDDAGFARPTRCVPWTVAELLYHVQMAVGRLTTMLADPDPDPGGTGLVTAAGYYRAEGRFSPSVNADRVQSAQRQAADLPDAATRVREFRQARDDAWASVRDAPPERLVRTRHGDRMLLAEFVRTRVFELAVHGLDLAVALDRSPWTTVEAAQVTEGLLLTPAEATSIRSAAGWDQVTLIAKLTGRVPVTADEAEPIRSAGIRRLALGQHAVHSLPVGRAPGRWLRRAR